MNAWLKTHIRTFSAAIHFVVGLAAAKFILQMVSLYLLSDSVAQYLIENRRPDTIIFYWFAGVLLAQILLLAWHDKKKLKLAGEVAQFFQTRLTQQLQAGSLAIIRDHSIASWQSFYIHRIPALQSYYSEYITQQRLATLVPVCVLLVVFPISWLVGLILLIAAPLIPLFMWLTGKGAAAAQQRHFMAMERLGSIFLDRLQARRLLHVHHAVSRQQQYFETAAQALKQKTLDVLRVAFLSSSVLDFFATVGMALVAVFVGFSLLGIITFGSWPSGLSFQEGLFALLLSPLFFSELKNLGRCYHLRAEALGAADVIETVLNRACCSSIPCDQSLTLHELTITTAQKKPLLFARQLTLNPGDHVLLQGDSGAGKTTLLEVLLGMRPAEARELQTLAREQVAWLSQQPVILASSVRENLALGTDMRASDIHQRLDHVGLSEWVSQLPQGLDTPLGDHPPMSGGQQQRLAIARLLLFDNPVVFLDEPTAHLGEDQATAIIALLQQHLHHKTVIWVSHELSCESFFNKRWSINGDGQLTQIEEDDRLCA